MQYLKADTNTEVLIGPVVAVGDGFTPVTTLSLSTADEAEIIKYGGATPLTVTSISANGFAAITGADGYYTLDISTSNSDTEGFLTVLINDDSLCLPVRVDFMVVNANVYDSLFAAAATDYLQTDVAQWLGTAAATPTTAGVPEVDVTYVSGTAQTANDNGADLNTLVTRIVGTLATGTHNPQSGDSYARLGAPAGVSVSADIATIDTNVDSVLVDTGTTLPATLGTPSNLGSGATLADNAADLAGATFDTSTDSQEALSDALSNVANTGSAVNASATTYVLTTGTQSANTYASTVALDGIRHEHTDTAGVMDLYYQFAIATGVPSQIKMTGYLFSANDSLSVYGYDWVAAGWVQIGTLSGSAAANSVNTYDTFTNMVGTGANLGLVRIRFYAASGLTTATLAIDQIFVSYSQSAANTLDRIYFDSNASNTGTVPGVDGTPGNPVSTEATVQTLLGKTNINKIELLPGSTYTAAAAHDNLIMYMHGATLALGGQSFNQTHLFHGSASGIATAAAEMELHDTEIGTGSFQLAHFYGCTFDGTVTFTLAGNYHIINCQSGVPGASAPTFTKTAGQTITAEWRRWSGGVTISGLEAGDVLTVSGELGTVTLNGADATVEIRGTYKALVNNMTGSPTVNVDGAILAADVAAILVDTGTTLPATIATAQADLDTLTGSDGVTLATSQPNYAPNTTTPPTAAAIRAEIDTNSTQLAAIVADTNELQTDDVPGLIAALNNLSSAQAQTAAAAALTAYDPPTNAEMEARTPTAAQLAYITAHAATAVPVTFSGGTTTTAILTNVDGSAASSTDDFYNGRVLIFNAGTLNLQVTDITDYVGSTTTATITAVTTAVTGSHTAIMV